MNVKRQPEDWDKMYLHCYKVEGTYVTADSYNPDDYHDPACIAIMDKTFYLAPKGKKEAVYELLDTVSLAWGEYSMSDIKRLARQTINAELAGRADVVLYDEDMDRTGNAGFLILSLVETIDRPEDIAEARE